MRWGRPDLNRGSSAPKAESLDQTSRRPHKACVLTCLSYGFCGMPMVSLLRRICSPDEQSPFEFKILAVSSPSSSIRFLQPLSLLREEPVRLDQILHQQTEVYPARLLELTGPVGFEPTTFASLGSLQLRRLPRYPYFAHSMDLRYGPEWCRPGFRHKLLPHGSSS